MILKKWPYFDILEFALIILNLISSEMYVKVLKMNKISRVMINITV